MKANTLKIKVFKKARRVRKENGDITFLKIKTGLFNIPNEGLYDYPLIKSKLQNLALKKNPFYNQFTM